MSSPTGAHTPHFPSHNSPRVWFLTSGSAPIATVLARQLLEHGDHVIAGLPTSETNALNQNNNENERITALQELLKEFGDAVEQPEGEEGGRFRVAGLDIRCASHRTLEHWAKGEELMG